MPPLTILIKPVSGRCNMRCQYCFYADEIQYRQAAMAPAMPLSILETAIRRVLRSAEGGAHFLFQGGEPTLAGLPFFEAAIAAQRRYNAASLQITNAIQTNGLHISDEMIAFFAREKFLVGVSLDGDEVTHDAHRKDPGGEGTWARARDNLEKMLAAGVACNVLCVVTQAAAARPNEVFEALAPYRWLQFIPCLDPVDGQTEAYSLSADAYASFLCAVFDQYERAWREGEPISIRMFDNWVSMLMGYPPENCAMVGHCGNSLMLESDGSLYPCDFYGMDDWYLGNITQSSYLKILQSPFLRGFVDSSKETPGQCLACPWYSLCRNGCRRERNEKDRVNRWCAAYRQFFPYAFARMRHMADTIKKEEPKPPSGIS